MAKLTNPRAFIKLTRVRDTTGGGVYKPWYKIIINVDAITEYSIDGDVPGVTLVMLGSDRYFKVAETVEQIEAVLGIPFTCEESS
jgi:hypothetical protein